MKKILALLLAMLLLCGACTAMAEDDTQILSVSTGFDITMKVPDGYAYSRTYADGMLRALLVPEADGLPIMELHIAFDELLEGSTINDYTDAQLQQMIDSYNLDFIQPRNSILTTDHGTRVIVTVEDCASDSYADLTTVYRGYNVTLLIVYEDGTAVTETDVTRGMQVLSDMEFVNN